MCRFRIAPSRVVVGQLASQYGVVCVMCMWGVAASFPFIAPSLAIVSAISFAITHGCVDPSHVNLKRPQKCGFLIVDVHCVVH